MGNFPDNEYAPNWVDKYNAKVKDQGDILPSPSRSDTGIQEYNVRPKQGTNTMGEFNLDSTTNILDNYYRNMDKYSDNGSNNKYFSGINMNDLEIDPSMMDMWNQEVSDPFRDFKFGMNMPTFQLGKGALDTGSNILNVFNNMRDYGLRKDQFNFTKDLGNKQYADARDVQNIKFDQLDYDRKERNLFKEKTMKDGGYVLQDPVNRRALG